MPDVIKHSKGTLGFKGRDGVVALKQGENAVAPLDWEAALKCPSIVERLESGDLEVVGGPEVTVDFKPVTLDDEDFRAG